MRSETVYVKTALGIAEIERRALGLGAMPRRLLILIDGHRAVGQLVHDNSRSMDVAGALEQLLSLGLIAERDLASGVVADVAVSAKATAGSLRHALIEMATSVLGEKHATRIAAKLDGLADNADELRKAIDNCVRLIRLTIDEGKAEDFRRQAEIILGKPAGK